MNHLALRAFTSHDYEAIAAIHNTLHSDRPVKVSDLVKADHERDPVYKHQRQVAVQDQKIVGYAVYFQSPYDYHPHRFGFSLNVLPECQRQGIGAALYDWMITALHPFAPIALKTDAYENHPGGIQFLKKRGFQEVFRERKSELDLTSFDPTPYISLRQKLEAEAIEFTTLKETESDSQCNPTLYQLERDLILDIPGVNAENFSWPDYATWLKDRSNLHPETYFLARYYGEYIGLSFMVLDEESRTAYQWLTGVRRDYRHRGIALILKVNGIMHAKVAGYPVIRTSTSVKNAPILNLNQHLGFVPLSEWVEMEKRYS